MGKSTISMAMFNSFLYVYQRVYPIGYQIISHQFPSAQPPECIATQDSKPGGFNHQKWLGLTIKNGGFTDQKWINIVDLFIVFLGYTWPFGIKL